MMRYEKKFINFGASKAVIIPDQWIKSLEKEQNKKMSGVYLDVNLETKISPMWEGEENE